MPRILIAIFLLITFGLCATAQTVHSEDVENLSSVVQPCNQCHFCDKPTLEDPCLLPCPRHSWKITTEHSEEEGPDVVILDELENLYFPVEFTHRDHAHMSVFGEGCTECHHYSPPGKIPPCIRCHGLEIDPNYPTLPGLKGAYHQKCMDCHKDWSGGTDCAICHLKKGEEGEIVEVEKPETPLVAEPTKRVYQTEMEEGPVVTFHHNQHVSLYGLDCVECHSGEGCGTCHHPHEKVVSAKIAGDPHARCFNCHQDASCNKCHRQQETAGFTHDQTGWPLNRFHKSLSCNACHGQNITRLDRTCTACHRDWSPTTFDHSKITGVMLGEIHASFDCSDCHLNKRFDKKPSCETCHDPEYSYPNVQPEF